MKKVICKRAIGFIILWFLVCSLAYLFTACGESETKISQISQFTLQYQASEGGVIQGETFQVVQEGKDGSVVTAVPNEGYEFEKWSDDVLEAERQDTNVCNDITVTAIFIKKTDTVPKQTFRIVYCIEGVSENNAYIDGSTEQYVPYGENATPVTAKSRYEEYGKFLYWSDGLETADRQEINVVCDMTITAYYGFWVDYSVEGNIGGKLVGRTNQRLLENESGESVTAVADAGYVFTGWSDLSMDPVHETEEAVRHWEYIAYFEPIQKTFEYDYGSLFNAPLSKSITIIRDEIQGAQFIVPTMEGYSFCGWYSDLDYSQKVVNEDGKLMLGYATFLLETNKLYAKWQRNDAIEEIPTYKILLTMTDEIHASLFSLVTETNVNVDYKMSGIERRLLCLLFQGMAEYLNQWFAGEVIFDVEAYFTTTPVGTELNRVGEDIISGGNVLGKTHYALCPQDIPEVWNLLGKYHSILNTFSLNDPDELLHLMGVNGSSVPKYGAISLESKLYVYFLNHVPLQDVYEEVLFEKNNITKRTIFGTYLHELTHTAEQTCKYDYDIFEYHKALSYSDDLNLDTFEITKLYLLHQLEIEGKKVGIPIEYWRHEFDVDVNYVGQPVDGWTAGKIIVVGEIDDRPTWNQDYVTRKVKYGGELTIEAVPNEGYRFVRWSDGVTTAVRYDVNIISYINVKAFFEKI